MTPQLSVGFTDARVFAEFGAISYGAGLFCPPSPRRVRSPFPRPRRADRRRVARPHLDLWQRVLDVSDDHTPTSIGTLGGTVGEQLGDELGQTAWRETGPGRRQRRARRGVHHRSSCTRSARSSSHVSVGRGLERRRPDQVDAIVPTVPATVDERDDVQAVPDVRTDVDVGEAELLVQLVAQRRFVVLARLLTATRRRPHGHVRELETHEQHAARRVEHEGGPGRANPQTVDVHLFSRFVGQVAVEGAVHLVDRLALLAERELLRIAVSAPHTWPHSASKRCAVDARP